MPLKWLIVILPLVFFIGGCNTQLTDKVDQTQMREMATIRKACQREECPCETPIGTIAHGSKIVVYSKDAVACNEGCGTYAEELTCNNGKFDKELDGLFFKCHVEECPSCTLGPNLILNGESIDVYNTAEVGCRKSCEDFKQRRTCDMGILSGSDDYNLFSCERKQCRCRLPDNSGYITLDGSIKLYTTEQSACGSTCEDNYAETRTCVVQSGTGVNEVFTLDGNPAAQFRHCQEPTDCFCTLPNNLGVLYHNDTKKLWTVEQVACGESCDTQNSLTVRCNNGTFKNNDDLNEVVDFSTPKFEPYEHVCSVEECVSCQVPGTTISVPHNNTYRFFKTNTPTCGLSCENLDRLCDNGTFSGDSTYSAAACQERTCKCDVPEITGFQVSVGSSWDFYSSEQASCGQSCQDIKSAKVCTEVENPPGTFTYEFPDLTALFSACEPPAGCACGLPPGLGQIEDEMQVRLTSQEIVPCGTSCNDVPTIDVRCDNSLLFRVDDNSLVDIADPSFQYNYFCQQATCTACELTGYGTINNNQTLTLYSKDELVCGDDPELFTFEFRCENSVLLRNNIAYNPAADPDAPAAWHPSYTINCPGCPLPWGGSIGEGTSITAYKFFGTVINNCGRGCKVKQRKCEHGVLQGDSSFDMKDCNNNCQMEGGGAPPRACLLRWQNSFVTPNAQIPMWKKKVVGCGDSCQNHFKLSTCNMETGTFDVPFDYIYQACTEVCSGN